MPETGVPIDTSIYENMVNNAQKKATVEANLKRLDYAAGNGLLSTQKKPLLPKEIYLFISAGGTGQNALRSIKELIEKTVDSDCRIKQVRYLVVDCAENELNTLVEQGVFKQGEIVVVPYEGTHDTIKPDRITADRETWVDRRLFVATGGDAPGRHDGFESNGAGAWRQPGRVRLTSEAGLSIFDRINSVIGELERPEGTKLKVFFLCSVAGGTGSGTIIDLVYMTRNVLETNYSDLYQNTRIFGFIFSPTACEGEIDSNHHPLANNYAAMKEIDYLMRLQDRGEKLKMRYGGRAVTFSKMLFDTCVLVDGETTAFAGFENKAKAARDVVAQSVLGCMMAIDVAGNAVQSLTESVFSNSVSSITAKIPRLSIAKYPRYVGYNFNAMGFASVKIPVELLTSVLVYEVLNNTWSAWQADPQPGYERIFLRNCGIRPKRRIEERSQRELLVKVEDEARKEIGVHGIAYMITLAKKASELLRDDPDYIKYAEKKKGDGWKNTRDYLNAVKNHLIGLNNTVWETMRIILVTFQKLLREEQKILTEVDVYERNFGSSLYFCPINLTEAQSTRRQAQALMQYITNGIYNSEQCKAIANDFTNEILFTDELAKLVGAASSDRAASSQFDAAELIRNFIENKFRDIIDKNIETFLVKFFAGDSNAEPTMPDPNQPARQIPTQALKDAAQNIYRTLTTRGMAMASTLDRIENKVSSRKFITVPDRCQNLYDLLKKLAETDNKGVKVHKSKSRDELLMITMLEGLPALAFKSIRDSEPKYEQHWNAHPGIHIEQHGEKEHNWVNLPNLVFTGEVDREATNLAYAKADYDKAEELGMVLPSVNNPGTEFKMICRLNKTKDVGSTVERLMTKEFDEYIRDILPNAPEQLTLDYCLQQLSQKGIVSYVDLYQNHDVLTATDEDLPDGFYYDYAWHTLRQMFHLWHAVKDTIPYVERLKAAIDEKLAVIQEQQRRAARITTFAQALRAYDAQPDGTEGPAVIRYDDGIDMWYIKPQINEQLLANVAYDSRTPNSTLYKECREYFAFVAFANLPDDVYQNVVTKLQARYPQDETGIARKIADKARGMAMAADFQARAAVTRRKDDGTLNFPMASVEFQKEADRIEPGLCDKIRSFYANDLIMPISN